jgi:vancomycin resistance protein YoaR
VRTPVVAALSLLGVAFTVAVVVERARLRRALVEQAPVTCEGHLLPADVPPATWISRIAPRLERREAFLLLPEGPRPTTFEALGIELDIGETLARIARTLPRPTLRDRVRTLGGSGGEPPDVVPAFSFDADKAREFLSQLGPVLRREPVDARLDLAAHRRIADEPGRELDVEATLAEIEAGERRDLALFDVRFRSLAPNVTADSLAAVDVSRVLSSFQTDFSKKSRSRVPNIRRAGAYLNGVVIEPGGVLSFNRVVGPRTFERGFRNAPVIVQDELEEGLGGGVCQVASTLFAAAMLGGLEIVTRRSHSRPSGYAPLGLDAVVIYPEVDLRLRNPYPLPVIVHATVPDDKHFRVELLGIEPPGKFEHFFGVAEREPFARRVAVKTDLAKGTVDRRQEGYAGYDGTSLLRLTRTDGSRTSHSYRSQYYPVPEVYWIASDVDPVTLPALPEGARGVELSDDTTAIDGERGDAREP